MIYVSHLKFNLILLAVYRCQNYPIFPAYCTLVQNPVDTCCPELYCDKEHAVPVLPPMYIPVKPSYTNSTPSVFGTAGKMNTKYV